jgi:hypothetical protein
MSWLCGAKENTAHSKPMTCRHAQQTVRYVGCIDARHDQHVRGTREAGVRKLDERIDDKRPQARDMAMVFENYAPGAPGARS